MGNAALLCLRTLASLAVLFQGSLAAGELSDPTFFLVATATMSVLGLLLSRARLRALPSLVAFVIIPLAARAALSGVVSLSGFGGTGGGGDASGLDALLLGFDRNFLIASVPMIWSAWSAYWAFRSHRFVSAETAINGALLAGLFTLFPGPLAGVYHRPVSVALVVAPIAAAELIVLALNRPAVQPRSRRRVAGGAAFAALLVCLGAAFLFMGPVEDRAVSRGGGLIKPTLFSSDFSQVLKLESEISLDDDLALIVRREEGVESIFLRRYILSGYDPKVGFVPEEGDLAEQPAELPPAERSFPSLGAKVTRRTWQEYYLVNIDSSAFLAMNRPIRVRPLQTPVASSFTSVYQVESEVSEAMPFELVDSVPGADYSPVVAALGEKEYRRLTEYGDNPRILAFAKEIAEGEGYWDRVQAVYERMKFGEFRYSLKPGIAADGDQIGRFLFESKKGYCSYFAFSMTLLLRSLGIPSRVAVGFYIDPEKGVFDYYPVRANMAHAWVEVFFPGYGWIDYDPTTDQMAEGESFQPPSAKEGKDFEGYLKEIIENRPELVQRTEQGPAVSSSWARGVAAALSLLRRLWPVFLGGLWLLGALLRRVWGLLAWILFRDPRRKAAALFDHAVLRLSLAGQVRGREEHYGAFSLRVDRALGLGFGELCDLRSRFLYDRSFGAEDLAALRSSYARFSSALARAVPAPRRALGWVFPFPSPLGPRRLSVLLVVLLAATAAGDRVYASVDKAVYTADDLYRQAESAISAESWEKAIAVLRGAEEIYPGDLRFPMTLGDIFAEQKLYTLAWNEYRAAERLDGDDPALLHKLATTAGHLNMDAQSASYLERMLLHTPDDLEALGDLSWMYFKLHRLRDGERLLLDAVRRLGPDAGFSMTLGTIYSDLYEYDESRKWYTAAIDDAKAKGAKTFLAVARYNLSILESKFYRYAQAFDQTYLSLSAADRASGHLARGELYLKRLDFRKTYAEYERAYALDVSPLSKVNLADAYRVAGRLNEAVAYASQALSITDHSWMINYGTNVKQFRRDVYDILSAAYLGLAESEKNTPRTGPIDAVAGTLRWVWYRLRAEFSAALHRKYALLCAREFMATGQTLDAWSNYLEAFSQYPDRAQRYLDLARAFEVSRIPAAAPIYEVEKAKLGRNPGALEAAIANLDPVWQRDIAADALIVLAKLPGTAVSSARSAAERAYALNRGALRQAGLRLPGRLVVQGDADGRTLRRLESILGNSYIEALPGGATYELSVAVSKSGTTCTLRDLRNGDVLLSKAFPSPEASRASIVALARKIGDSLFGNP